MPGAALQSTLFFAGPGVLTPREAACYRPRALPLPLARLLFLVMAVVPFARYAEGQPGSSAPAAPAAPVQETTVRGTPPDLSGRWLSLGWVELPDGRSISSPALWEIAVQEGKPVMTHRFVSLPPAQSEALDKANAAGEAWKPSPEDLAQIRAAWGGLQSQDSHVARVTNEISGRDAFDDSLKNEARTKDAIWVVRQRQDFDGSAGAPVRQVTIYSVLAPSGRDYTGNFDSATIAAAPFPIPISFKGTFHLYRLDEPASHGVLARLLDVFAGCGRRESSSGS